MDNEILYGISTPVLEFTPFAKLSHFASGDSGAGPGGGVTDAGAGGGGGDAGGNAGATDAGAGGAGGGDAEASFLSDAATDQAGDTTTQATETTTTEGTDQVAATEEGTTTEEIDPATGLPKPKVAAPVPTPEQQEQQRVEEETLKDFYAQTPELKDFLKAHPAARAQFFKAAQMNQIYTSVEDARMAADYASELSTFDKLYASPKPEDTKGFVDALWTNSLQDPDKPFHPTANPSRGNFERVATAMTEVGFRGVLGNIENAAKAVGLNPQQATRALEYVATMLGLNPIKGLQAVRGGGAPAGTGQPTPQEEALTAREAALQAREQAMATQAQQAFESGVARAVDDHILGEVNKALKPAEAALAKQPKLVQDTIRKTIADRTIAAIQSDKPFQVRFETEELRGNRDAAHQDRLLSLMKSRVNDELPRQANSVMREMGLSIVTANQQRLAAKQAAAGRREVPVGSPGALRSPGARPGGRGTPTNAGKGQSWDQHADATLKDFVEGP